MLKYSEDMETAETAMRLKVKDLTNDNEVDEISLLHYLNDDDFSTSHWFYGCYLVCGR